MADDAYRIAGLDVSDWFDAWMSRQQILTRMAKSHPVVYSRGALHAWQRFKPAWRKAGWTSSFEENFGVLVHRRPRFPLRLTRFPTLDNVTLRWIARDIRNAFDEQGLPLIAYVFHPKLWPVARELNADLTMYHAYDEFSSYPGRADSEVELEKDLVLNADIVCTMSEKTATTLRTFGRDDIKIVPNGVDFDRFSAVEGESVPDDFASIAAPRIVYFGNVSEKVDLALIRRIAEARPDWSLVIVGGDRLINDESKQIFEQLKALPNFHWLGHKRYRDMPRYMRAADVNLLTYKMGVGLWSEACSPLKLYEYLAVGQPVVSADLQVTRAHDDVVSIASGEDEWLQAIGQALEPQGRERIEAGRDIARQNTWDARIEMLESLIAEGLADRRR